MRNRSCSPAGAGAQRRRRLCLASDAGMRVEESAHRPALKCPGSLGLHKTRFPGPQQACSDPPVPGRRCLGPAAPPEALRRTGNRRRPERARTAPGSGRSEPRPVPSQAPPLPSLRPSSGGSQGSRMCLPPALRGSASSPARRRALRILRGRRGVSTSPGWLERPSVLWRAAGDGARRLSGSRRGDVGLTLGGGFC